MRHPLKAGCRAVSSSLRRCPFRFAGRQPTRLAPMDAAGANGVPPIARAGWRAMAVRWTIADENPIPDSIGRPEATGTEDLAGLVGEVLLGARQTEEDSETASN